MSTNTLAVPHYQNVGNPGYVNPGEIIGKNVRRLREQAGMSVNRLAREIGVRLNTIQAIEAGKTQKSKHLPDIARIFMVPLSEIDPAQRSNGTNPAVVPARELTGERDVPVYGTTEAGEGVMVLTSEPVDKADRPASLTHVPDAYGVIVTGSSMVPAVRAGDIVVVHPHKHPRREDLCVFRSEKHGEFCSTIKEFVAETKDGWRVKRYRPQEREFVLKRSEWPQCHVVVTVHRR